MNMIDLIKKGDKREIIDAMIENRSRSAQSNVRYEERDINFKGEAIKVLHPDTEFPMPVIRIEKFLETMLDIDDFSLIVNEELYSLEKDDSEKTIEKLKEKDYEIEEENYSFKGYTYNGENDLSHDITLHTFEYEGEHYVFISVHYGADARIGFGPMVCFKINDIDYFMNFTIDVYDSKTDEDFSTYELDDIANYNAEKNEWIRKDNGNTLSLYTPADGY